VLFARSIFIRIIVSRKLSRKLTGGDAHPRLVASCVLTRIGIFRHPGHGTLAALVKKEVSLSLSLSFRPTHRSTHMCVISPSLSSALPFFPITSTIMANESFHCCRSEESATYFSEVGGHVHCDINQLFRTITGSTIRVYKCI